MKVEVAPAFGNPEETTAMLGVHRTYPCPETPLDPESSV